MNKAIIEKIEKETIKLRSRISKKGIFASKLEKELLKKYEKLLIEQYKKLEG